MTTITLTTTEEIRTDGSSVYNLIFRDISKDGAPEIMRLSAVDYESADDVENAMLKGIVDIDIQAPVFFDQFAGPRRP